MTATKSEASGSLVMSIICCNLIALGLLFGAMFLFLFVKLLEQTGNPVSAFFLSIMFGFLALLFSFSSSCSSYGACLPVPLPVICAVVTLATILWHFRGSLAAPPSGVELNDDHTDTK